MLYNDINISIVEGSSTEGVHSWFPMFFPLKRPIKMKKGNYAVVHIWRLSSNDGVWYEWTLSQEEPVFAEDGREISTRCIESTEIHNSRGTSIMWKISPDMA